MTEDKVIYFVRHGRTDWNDQQRVQGSSDIPLAEQGIKQAQRASVRLENIPAQVIYSSPMLRAAQTAEIIAAGKRDIIYWQELREKSYGVWEGKTINEILEKFPNDFANWIHHLPVSGTVGGETEAECFKRAAVVAQKLKEVNDRKIIVVTHGAILRFFLISLLGAETAPLLWNYTTANCSVTAVKIDKKGKATLLFLNDCMHHIFDTANKKKLEQKIRALPPLPQQ